MVLRKRKKAPRLAASSSVFTTCVCIHRERQHLPPLCIAEKPSTVSHIRTVSIMPINCTELASLHQWYYLPTMYSLEFCLGFLGDLPIILGYIFRLKEWKSTDIYLFNPAVSDLLFLCTPTARPRPHPSSASLADISSMSICTPASSSWRGLA
ncbi:hypothetical protein AGOR_G00253000 [Albula goreensis]|uniref:Uncharacterized protein n=1 Tax=Albula goreensis TaxID=1534307 RepID=A0A8T3CFQ5_9TELE|nr:hypothetical protein AGOR_G00253000 [Albula goreensis]